MQYKNAVKRCKIRHLQRFYMSVSYTDTAQSNRMFNLFKIQGIMGKFVKDGDFLMEVPDNFIGFRSRKSEADACARVAYNEFTRKHQISSPFDMKCKTTKFNGRVSGWEFSTTVEYIVRIDNDGKVIFRKVELSFWVCKE